MSFAASKVNVESYQQWKAKKKFGQQKTEQNSYDLDSKLFSTEEIGAGLESRIQAAIVQQQLSADHQNYIGSY